MNTKINTPATNSGLYRTYNIYVTALQKAGLRAITEPRLAGPGRILITPSQFLSGSELHIRFTLHAPDLNTPATNGTQWLFETFATMETVLTTAGLVGDLSTYIIPPTYQPHTPDNDTPTLTFVISTFGKVIR